MDIEEIKVSIKEGLIEWFRTGKLGWFRFITAIMVVVAGGDVFNVIYNSIKTEELKDKLLTYLDCSIIVKNLIPNIIIRRALLISIIIMWLLIWYFRQCYKEPVEQIKKIIHVFGHSTMGKSQLIINEEYCIATQASIEPLDLIESMKETQKDYGKLKYVVNDQDKFIEKFKNNINNNDKYGYMGIAHTPLILRAGFQIGDETKFTLFHKKRNMDYYEELNESQSYTSLRIEKKDIMYNCKELIVAISTTFQIQDNELNILKPESKSIIKFKADELGFDVITSKKQIEEYVTTILGEVRQIVKDNGIMKIHMVISSSVTFTYALGQALSNHYDPKILIYHYDNNNPKIYPWGIDLFESYAECIIVN